MESISSKASPNEIQKLQKKNEALVQEKNNLLTKIRELEKEANSKMFRGERDREKDELRSKLKAAENLCENLMDENEDMKKEIRQLEEEIYELQDTFRTANHDSLFCDFFSCLSITYMFVCINKCDQYNDTRYYKNKKKKEKE